MERSHNETHVGSMGWLALAAGVVLWDATAEESLSHACWRGLENPISRPAVAAGIGVTVLHLLHAIPEHLDPFYTVARLFNREP